MEPMFKKKTEIFFDIVIALLVLLAIILIWPNSSDSARIEGKSRQQETEKTASLGNHENRGPLKPVLNQPFVITLQPGEETGWVSMPKGSTNFLVESKYVVDGETADGRKFRILPDGVNPLLTKVKPGRDGELFKLQNLSALEVIKVAVSFK